MKLSMIESVGFWNTSREKSFWYFSPFEALQIMQTISFSPHLVKADELPSGLWICSQVLPTGEFLSGHCLTLLALEGSTLYLQTIQSSQFDVFGQWEETGAPTQSQGEHAQSTQERSEDRPSWCEMAVLTQCKVKFSWNIRYRRRLDLNVLSSLVSWDKLDETPEVISWCLHDFLSEGFITAVAGIPQGGCSRSVGSVQGDSCLSYSYCLKWRSPLASGGAMHFARPSVTLLSPT